MSLDKTKSTNASFSYADVEDLRTRLQGSTLVPDENGYDEACWTIQAHFRQRPAIVVLPEITADVIAAVQFAREHQLPIGVQSGGHGHPFDAASMDGALLINFVRMKKIQIDEREATARVESGVIWSEIIPRVHKYGLAPLNGFAGSVGAVGYLLGAGWGWLVRQYGIATTSVRSIEVITADGRLLQVSAQSHPDLFWGLRGAGANFGVVTSIEFALYPVKEFFGGEIVYPIELAKEVMSKYVQWVKTLPETLTSMMRMMKYADDTNVPPQLRGKTTISVCGCYNGSEAEGAALFQPMCTLGTPLLDTFALKPYTQVATITNDPNEEPSYYHNYSRMWHDFTVEDSEALLDIASDPASGVVRFEFRHLGGVAARLPEDEMAVSMRGINFFLFILGEAPSVEELEAARRSITKIMQAIPPDTEVHVEINGLELTDVGVERTRAAYTAQNYQRLVELKRKYDPQNVFHFNNNIPPTA